MSCVRPLQRMCGLALWLLAAPLAADDQTSTPETHTVTPAPFQIQVELEGVFEAEHMAEVVLRPDVFSGLVVEKAVPQGTRVNQGDPILWLETERIDDQLRNMEFQLEQSRLSLQQAELDLSAAEQAAPLDLRAAERAKQAADKELEHYLRVGADLALRSAQESLKSSEYSLEYAQEELAQLEKMYLADDLTEETEEIILKRARRDVERSEFFLEGARVRHERTVNEQLPRQKEELHDATERAALALQRAQATIPRSLEEKRIGLQKLRYAHADQTKQYEKLKADRELMVVKAPATGVVYYGQCERGKWPMAATLAKQLRKGGSISPNQVVMTVVSPGSSFARVDVTESSLRFVKPGTACTIVPAAYPRLRMTGAVAAVEPIPIADGRFDGRVSILGDPGGAAIVPAMNCKVKVTAYSKPDALAVPSSAVFSEDTDADQKYVYVAVEGGEPRKQSVQIGEVSGDRTEVLSGLSAGDKILLQKPKK